MVGMFKNTVSGTVVAAVTLLVSSAIAVVTAAVDWVVALVSAVVVVVSTISCSGLDSGALVVVVSVVA